MIDRALFLHPKGGHSGDRALLDCCIFPQLHLFSELPSIHTHVWIRPKLFYVHSVGGSINSAQNVSTDYFYRTWCSTESNSISFCTLWLLVEVWVSSRPSVWTYHPMVWPICIFLQNNHDTIDRVLPSHSWPIYRATNLHSTAQSDTYSIHYNSSLFWTANSTISVLCRICPPYDKFALLCSKISLNTRSNHLWLIIAIGWSCSSSLSPSILSQQIPLPSPAH